MYMEWRTTECSIVLRGLIEFSIYWTEHLLYTRFSPGGWTGSLNKGVDPASGLLVFLGRRMVLFSRLIPSLPQEVCTLKTVRPGEGKWLGSHSELVAMPGLKPELPDFVFLQFFILLYLSLASLGRWCCAGAFSGCNELGLLLYVACWGSFCFRAQAFGAWASAVVAYRLCCPKACAVFQDQGSNLCALHQ